MEHYKECMEYYGELAEYDARTFITYFDEVTWVMTERGMDVVLPILVELKKSLVLSKPN